MKDVILKANMSMDFVVSLYKITLHSCMSEISCGSILVNIPALLDMFIEAVSLNYMSSTQGFLYITAWWQRVGWYVSKRAGTTQGGLV
jgi:hypothetical protein